MTNITKALAIVFIATSASSTVTFADTKAYGYLFGSKEGTHGFVSFETTAPQTLTAEGGRDYSDIYPSAGEYVDGKIYTYRVAPGDYYEIMSDSWAVYDGETFKEISSKSKSSMNRAVDMTYDYTTNTMYALIEDKYTDGKLTPTSLYAVDLTTGDYTFIASPGELKAIDGNNRETTDALITIACDPDGQLYAMSNFRYLYKIDKYTGKVEQAAPQHNLGTAAQFQTMAFDTSGKLWWAQQHPDYGHFCEIDLTTGIPGGFVDFRTDYEKLNKLGNDAQVTALFFKDKSLRKNSIKAVTELKAEIEGSKVNTVKLTWTLPTQDYSGNESVATAIKVYRIGTSEPIATLEGNATSYTDNEAPNGDTTYEVITMDESGAGFPAFATVFAGYDQLNAVGEITLNVTDRTATVRWTAPTTTVNGGYADFDAITYNVYRAKGEILTSVATSIEETEFTETVTEDGGFCYVIEPVCGGVAGVRAKSDSFTLSSPTTIPYFTGFEDDGDGPQWTFINDPSSKGWSIGKKSYVYEGQKTAIGSTNGNPANDWLISPPISFEVGDYTLDFYGNGASYDNHSYDVCLGSDPKAPESFTQKIHSVSDEKVYDENGPNATGSETKGWAHVSVDFKVDKAGIYYLGVHNLNTTTWANLRIDNLSIKKSGSSGISSISVDKQISVATIGGTVVVTATCEVDKVSIINMAGSVVMSAKGDGNNASVSLSELAGGVYIVSVSLADGTTEYRKVSL